MDETPTPPSRNDYKRVWRQNNVEKARASSNASYAKNCEVHRASKRARYQLEKEARSVAAKADVKCCPLCNIEYKRKYLKTHMMNRHKLTEDQLPHDLMHKL